MLDPASPPGQRTLGYWTGLRHVKTIHCLYDVWRNLNVDRRAFSHIATSGQSAARLDRWLISEQLRARVSKEPQATGHVIGYPGDHLGVSLTLTAPATTIYGAVVWRLPLHLLDDQPFCDRIAEEVPAYLAAHPLGPELARAAAWKVSSGRRSTPRLRRAPLPTQASSGNFTVKSPPSGSTNTPGKARAHRANGSQVPPQIAPALSLTLSQVGTKATPYCATTSVETRRQVSLRRIKSQKRPRPSCYRQWTWFPPQRLPQQQRGPMEMGACRLQSLAHSLPRNKAPGMDGIPYEFYMAYILLACSGLGPVLNHVVDATQTGFLPNRWVGDNVLADFEETSYLQETQEPGVILFLDFEKAFDRLDRPWIERCMAAVGFDLQVHICVRARQRESLTMAGTRTPSQSGPAFSSPLSPLLFVLAIKPMVAHARRLAQQQAFQPIRLPSGDPAPVMHQHADDISIHARSPRDAQVILDTSVDLHCAATGSNLQRGMPGSWPGELEPPCWSRCGHTSRLRSAGGEREALGHSSVQGARRRRHSPLHSLLQKMELRIARWSGFRLSLLGRAYFANQAPLFLGKEASFRAAKDGSIAPVDIRSQISALQAKVIGRLLKPEQLAWKAFFDFWLYRSPAWVSA
ncbi:g8834 [Coccomyxa elongata]